MKLLAIMFTHCVVVSMVQWYPEKENEKNVFCLFVYVYLKD